VPLDAFLLAFGAAWLHGTSNAFLGRRREPDAAIAVAMLVGVVLLAPAAAATWGVRRSALPFIAASALLELGYFGFLAAAYRAADVRLVYPVARGGAPILVLLGAVVVLGRGASAGQVAGVVAVSAGIMLVRRLRIGRGPDAARGFLLASITALFIAGYTLVDKQGLQHANPVPYLELVMIVPAIVYALAVAKRRGGRALRGETSVAVAAIGAALSVAYVLVLFALRHAPAASVSAVRETSVVIATLVAARAARERPEPLGLLGAALVAAGIALVALTG
jgi:drug/metabolite transporter (DMT)-like permease